MLLAPMFYTDTTDSWRVALPRQRLAVASAGILVEMAIACLALFLWSFLPEGDLRSICFFVAVTALVLSLVVNLSPFMRFDGYHMLSDALAMPGLGPRAFALGNWHLRRLLFATREPPPEVFAPQWSMGLAVFAWMTWAYRLSLFAGIAWLIYVTLPKAVGFPLAVIEVWFFILRPVLAALRQWFSAPLRAGFGVARSLSSLAVALILGVLALLPLDRHIHVPAILSAREQAWIYPSEAARLTRLMAHPGDQVNSGQLLAELHSPELESLQEQAAIRAGLLAERLRQIASGAKGAETARSLQEELAAVTRELDGLKARKALLAIHAPFTGVLAATGQSPVSGQWLGREDLLFHLRGPEATTVTGLLPERFEGRLFAGAPVVFVAEDGATAPVMGRLEALGMRGGEGLAADYLSTINGGPLLAERDPVTGQTLPLGGHLPFLADMQGAAPGRVLRGTAIITAEPQSLAYMAFGRIATVVLRESGF
jgi:putative peptide zinc metalloprotease protein